ncbi:MULTISPECIES: RidA family protein [unclassified Polaribacter]|uniref:RidA family protein n=1 Tax=unclassified Polaribacter TaxID=196858 RepID=UPI0011BE93F7|nr:MULTISPECIES: Rid family detoxifying hydrolase [unclassified Polaribacter]TXD49499.1 RidA family protein [Polaribacter sp. IC063]TXD56183.1 RidA family protein [Polaribacter sp. IC066]
MKLPLKIFIIFLFLVNVCCKNNGNIIIKYHKSHEKSRQNAPFSDAVQVDNLYFLTGQIGKDHTTGKIVEGGIEAETRQTIKNIEAVLKYHNLNLKDVVKCTVILSDINDFGKMNTIYRSFFSDTLPARTTFGANLVGNAKIEIEVVAVKN